MNYKNARDVAWQILIKCKKGLSEELFEKHNIEDEEEIGGEF